MGELGLRRTFGDEGEFTSSVWVADLSLGARKATGLARATLSKALLWQLLV